ncbi:MAG: hypothetical protein AAGM36_06920 [Cyanobacteria bacterium J06597_1]
MSSQQKSLLLGFLCIAMGLFPIAHSLNLLPISEQPGDAPRWVIGVCGMVFVLSGCMMMTQLNSRLNHILAAIFLALMGSIGVWVSLFSQAEGMSGGLFFLSREQNVLLGRCLFGLGAAIGFAMCVYAIRLAFSRMRSVE